MDLESLLPHPLPGKLLVILSLSEKYHLLCAPHQTACWAPPPASPGPWPDSNKDINSCYPHDNSRGRHGCLHLTDEVIEAKKIKWPKVTQLLPLWQKTLVIVYKFDSLPVQEGLQMRAGLPHLGSWCFSGPESKGCLSSKECTLACGMSSRSATPTG